MASQIKDCSLCGDSIWADKEFQHVHSECRGRRKNMLVYVTLLRRHGEMVAYYIGEHVRGAEANWQEDYTKARAVEEAIEAWHLALQLDDKTLALALSAVDLTRVPVIGVEIGSSLF